MKKISIAILLLSFAILAANVKSNYKSITVYNNGFSLLKTKLELNLKKGKNNYFWNDIPSTIQTSSLIFDIKKANLLSQNYEYDLASTYKVLEKYIGKNISVTTKNNQEVSGKLIYAEVGRYKNGSYCGISNAEGLKIVSIDDIKSFNLDNLPKNFFIKPTLNLEIFSKKNTKTNAEASFLCNQISWRVKYNMVYDDDSYIAINPWVTIENNTGKSYKDIELKLMAGDIKRPSQGNRYKSERYAGSGEVMYNTSFADDSNNFKEKEFADFHLYTLGRNISINNKQVKQMQLFEPKKVKAVKKFIGSNFYSEVKIEYSFKNSKKNKLGMPLPAGEIFLYKKDNDDKLEFIGSSTVNNTTTNAEVKFVSGNAFDITIKNKQLNYNKTKDAYIKENSATILNGSSKKAVVYFYVITDYNTTIYKSNVKNYKKISATKYEFKVTVKAKSNYIIEYTTKQNREK